MVLQLTSRNSLHNATFSLEHLRGLHADIKQNLPSTLILGQSFYDSLVLRSAGNRRLYIYIYIYIYTGATLS